MNSVSGKLGVKYKRLNCIILAILFSITLVFASLYLIYKTKRVFLIFLLIFAFLLALMLPNLFDFNKKYVLDNNEISIYKRRLKPKRIIKLKTVTKVETYKFLKEEFVGFETLKSITLIPVTTMEEKDKNFIKDVIKVNKFKFKDKKKVLYK